MADTPPAGLTVQQADALWDAVAIPGPHTPTFPEQHERVCRAVAEILAELPPPADRAEYIEAEVQRLINIRSAVLHQAAEQYERLLADIGADTAKDPRYWTGVQHVITGLRRMADEAQQPDPKPTLTPCTCRQTIHALEHTNRPVDDCPWCTPTPDIRPNRATGQTVATVDTRLLRTNPET